MESAQHPIRDDGLIAKVEALIHKISTENHEEESWRDMLDDEEYRELSDVTLTECHVIDCIERNPHMNAIGISKQLNITKGGISRITARLLHKKLIETRRSETNRKEIYYTLTPLGKRVFSIHELLHAQVREKIIRLFDGYSEAELTCIANFLSGLTEII